MSGHSDEWRTKRKGENAKEEWREERDLSLRVGVSAQRLWNYRLSSFSPLSFALGVLTCSCQSAKRRMATHVLHRVW